MKAGMSLELKGAVFKLTTLKLDIKRGLNFQNKVPWCEMHHDYTIGLISI